MLINVLDKNRNKIAIVDTYTSLMWCKRYFDIGALDLQIEATKENIALFKEGRYITRDDDETVFVIRSVSVDTQANHDNHLIVGGVDVKSILNQRIVWNITNFKGNVEDYIFKLVNENIVSPSISDRRIDGFFLGEKFGIADTITQQVSYKPLDETVIDVCKKYDLGWKIELDEDNNFIFLLYRGVDRSQRQDEVPPVIFSPEFDNLASSKYKTDSTKFKNVALVGGEGEGVDRKTTIAGGGSGLDRYEMFVDNASSSTNTGATLSNAEYLEQLKNKGESELAKNTKTTDFEGEVVADSFKYKVDYDLGDTVTVSNEFGVTAEAKIVEIVETWDSEGYTLEPIFEFSEVTELVPVEEGVLLAENGMALMTLGNRAIVAEQPEEYTDGVRISDLEPVTELYGGCCFPIVQDGETKRVTIDTLADSLGIDEIEKKIESFTPEIEYDSSQLKVVNKTINNGILFLSFYNLKTPVAANSKMITFKNFKGLNNSTLYFTGNKNGYIYIRAYKDSIAMGNAQLTTEVDFTVIMPVERI